MIEIINLTENTNVELKKKGRKSTQLKYFDVPEEQAVVRYLEATSYEERNKIYNDFLKKPLDKMISSIIRRYKLYIKDMDFTDIHMDTHSFLMTKIEKFKPSRNKKAYSYFGTICKNYLIGQIIKDQKETNRKISYEDVLTSLENNSSFSYNIEKEGIDSEKVIKNFLLELGNLLKNENLSENEIKLGHALYDLFENYESIFIGNDNNKFNKNIILLSLREMTNLSTKEIRGSMKKYKAMYYTLVENMLK